jgi:protein-S-isoprenylcysteine O-methyltransferase Ste14
MDNMKPKLITKQAVVIDVVLTVVFFVWITSILKKHVPWSEAGQTAVLLGAAYLFRVTLADQMLQKTAGSKDAA